MLPLATKIVDGLLDPDVYQEYGDIAAAVDPASWCTQRTEKVGRKCWSANYEWKAAVPEHTGQFLSPMTLRVRFTATTTLVPQLLSTVNPVTPTVEYNGQEYAGQVFSFLAGSRGPEDISHLIKIFRACQEIERRVVPVKASTPGDYLALMAKIMDQYDDKGTI